MQRLLLSVLMMLMASCEEAQYGRGATELPDARMVQLALQEAERRGLSVEGLSLAIEQHENLSAVYFLPPPHQLGGGFRVSIDIISEEVVEVRLSQ